MTQARRCRCLLVMSMTTYRWMKEGAAANAAVEVGQADGGLVDTRPQCGVRVMSASRLRVAVLRCAVRSAVGVDSAHTARSSSSLLVAQRSTLSSSLSVHDDAREVDSAGGSCCEDRPDPVEWTALPLPGRPLARRRPSSVLGPTRALRVGRVQVAVTSEPYPVFGPGVTLCFHCTVSCPIAGVQHCYTQNSTADRQTPLEQSTTNTRHRSRSLHLPRLRCISAFCAHIRGPVKLTSSQCVVVT